MNPLYVYMTLFHNANVNEFYSLLTGVKLIVLADPRQGTMEGLLKKIYELYADYALKNPFYSIDMPVR